MRIGISSLMIQRGKTGVASYLFSLLQGFQKAATSHLFFLFVFEEDPGSGAVSPTGPQHPVASVGVAAFGASLFSGCVARPQLPAFAVAKTLPTRGDHP
jgi:hypothetical protein